MTDPHDNSFIAKNLRQEEWVEYQRDPEVKEYVDAIKTAFEGGMVARMSCSTLFDLGFIVACKAGTLAVLISCSGHAHWAAMALSMLSHGRFEFYPKEECYRFSKSPFDQPPMWHDNIEYVSQKGFHFLVPVRKEIETETFRSSRHGQNDKAYGTSGKRDSVGDAPRQSSLFDLYPSGQD